MLIVFAVEQFLQAFASFGGAPITSCIQDIFGLNVGVYITAGAIISSGLVSFIIMIIEYEENKVKQENNSKLAEEEKINLIVSDELDSG
ncbi:hypothetical protein EB796_013020 [Bugula neritina]|uniref:Uncharacterized protein n=1 Tax=Bugula neritina TaxID=10212 RepID=A0A7J7JQM8_BUGNE|nr:hypothetical protein EB796_013020 [Bugula neritina]